jgi:hypothetical protein
VGNSHAEPHIPCYSVERLRDAMARMIMSELEGERVEVKRNRVIRSVGTARNGVCQRGQQQPLSLAK